MAITASGLYVQTFEDFWDGTDVVMDWVNDTIKGALFTNSVTNPDFDTDTAYGVAPYNANEVANGNGYTTGGATVGATKTVNNDVAGAVVFDGGDLQWTSSSFTARGVLLYDDTATTPVADFAICLVNFTSDATTSNGTFTITWALPTSGGIWNIDLTP